MFYMLSFGCFVDKNVVCQKVLCFLNEELQQWLHYDLMIQIPVSIHI